MSQSTTSPVTASASTAIHHKTVLTPTLSIAYEEHGPPSGPPTILLHGFPYSPAVFSSIAPALAIHGHRVIIPYLRGYGPTRFLCPSTPRSGQQAALAADLLALLDALALPTAALMGFDWGGRAACIVAALWPERVRCLVTAKGYNVQNIAVSGRPLAPSDERALWYQYYFHSERGRAGLEKDRRGFCELLWKLWSPTWEAGAGVFEATAAAFENEDWVDVVVHSYRHRYGLVEGDPGLEGLEKRIAELPSIGVPTISLDGADDGIAPAGAEDRDAAMFTGSYERRVLEGVGHNIPGEAPAAVVQALLDLQKT